MVRYKFYNPNSAGKGGTVGKRRPKPLHGAKKYDKAFLKCTHSQKLDDGTILRCENEFLVSKAVTPAKRYCAEHFTLASKPKVQVKNQKMVALFKSYGF